MKKKIAKYFDEIVMYLSHSITNSRKTFYELEQISFKESAEFIHQNLTQAVLLHDKKEFWRDALSRIVHQGLILEFGVFEGDSINYFSEILSKKNDSRTLYGFDSFEGLSENWSGTNMVKSTFDRKGLLPKVHQNISLVKGWIDQTLPGFITKEITEHKIAFMHLDMDTYTPTKIVLENTVDYLKEGTIILFDELLGYPGWKENEYKALTEIIAPKWEYEFISFCEPKMHFRNTSILIRAGIRILKQQH